MWIFTKRWEAKGGSSDDVSVIALWSVPAGIVGARIYHVITDAQLYRDEPWEALYIWDGGLGIWGGIALGVATGLLVGRRRGLASVPLLDAVAPALAVAQAIGRWGNWFNQELFGGPTSLPWGLEIDIENRPAGFTQFETFHPAFLYESLWNLALAGALIALSRRSSRPGTTFLCYVAGYTFGRFFIEGLRIDAAHELLGMRVNEWVSLVLFAASLALLAFRAGRDRREEQAPST